MSTMTYRGYTAEIEVSPEDDAFIGHIAGIRDIVGFHGESVAELKAAFEEAVEDYLETCERLGVAPRTPDANELTLKVPLEVRESLALAAEGSGKSIDQIAAEVLARASHG